MYKLDYVPLRGRPQELFRLYPKQAAEQVYDQLSEKARGKGLKIGLTRALALLAALAAVLEAEFADSNTQTSWLAAQLLTTAVSIAVDSILVGCRVKKLRKEREGYELYCDWSPLIFGILSGAIMMGAGFAAAAGELIVLSRVLRGAAAPVASLFFSTAHDVIDYEVEEIQAVRAP